MSKKARDGQGRWRSKTIGVRVSPEENEEINALAALSGMSKQSYAIMRMLNRDVVVIGNPKVYKALKRHMEELITVFSELEFLHEVSPESLHVAPQRSALYIFGDDSLGYEIRVYVRSLLANGQLPEYLGASIHEARPKARRHGL